VFPSFLSYTKRQVFHSEKSPHGYRQELCPLPLHTQSSVCNPSSCALCVDDCLPSVSANQSAFKILQPVYCGWYLSVCPIFHPPIRGLVFY
jgi:hypothetical protein